MKIFRNLLKLSLALQIAFVQSAYANKNSVRECSEAELGKIATIEAQIASSDSDLNEASRLMKIEKDKGNYILNRNSNIVGKVGVAAAVIGGLTATFARYQETGLGGLILAAFGILATVGGHVAKWITDDPEAKVSVETLELKIEKLTADSQFLKIQLRGMCAN